MVCRPERKGSSSRAGSEEEVDDNGLRLFGDFHGDDNCRIEADKIKRFTSIPNNAETVLHSVIHTRNIPIRRSCERPCFKSPEISKYCVKNKGKIVIFFLYSFVAVTYLILKSG